MRFPEKDEISRDGGTLFIEQTPGGIGDGGGGCCTEAWGGLSDGGTRV